MLFNLSPALIIGFCLTAALTYVIWCFTYFKRCKIPSLAPNWFIPGRQDSLLNRKTAISIHIRHLYEKLKANKHMKYCGIYFPIARPMLIVTDLDLLKLVLTKDFDHFTDRGLYYNEQDDPLSAHLFALDGVKWRNMRVKLTPTFTSGKMRSIFGTLTKCGVPLKAAIDQKLVKHEPIDVRDVLGCFTTDVIGSCAFGLDCNSFQDSEESPFRIYGKKALTVGRLKRLIIASFPNLAKMMRVKRLPSDVTDFFMQVIADTVNYRERNHIERKDFLQLLIEIKNNPEEAMNATISSDDVGKTLTIEQVAAQSLLFFLAGFETSSALMTFALYELAKHQEIQDQLRREIVDVLKKQADRQITYDSIKDLKYMDQVLDETLRKYPPLPFTTRTCVRDYKIPNSVDDGAVIKKGMRVLIPTIGIHYDPEYYPDPDKFNPSRFSKENKQSRHHYAFLPFGEGPRNCIGLRFGLMQSKVGIAILLQHFKFSLNPKTKQPLKLEPGAIILTAEGGIWLDVDSV